MTHTGTKQNRSPRVLAGACLILGVVLYPASAAAQGASLRIGPFVAMSASAMTLRDSIVELARAQVGRRYRTGGSSPERGFDCSELVQYVMSRLEIQVPRTADAQAEFGVALDRDTTQLRPGDLLTFTARGKERVSHIAVYVGNGRYVHASSVARRVIESPLNRPPDPRIKLWLGARRMPFAPDDVPVPADVIAARER
jgi:cell wall-associated NlpC family hydrolase